MIGQLYVDLEEIENLKIDLTCINAVKHVAKQRGYGQATKPPQHARKIHTFWVLTPKNRTNHRRIHPRPHPHIPKENPNTTGTITRDINTPNIKEIPEHCRNNVLGHHTRSGDRI